ncbi:unnamed protein product [Zymoseptoria tritici ST99CH_1E4]|uniref:Uncharacterized protein n=1 Tax=Zymoseptoria tritici ST99CH_1E4 TaxID=1276532 RepID=A0A2H1GUD2_ZYMTR|nr:unnamed protein product [Zymoseptoria tritici ST99CH_1E4]
MAINHFAEKDGFAYRSLRSRIGRVGIVLCQQILVWSALYIAASAIYTLAVGAVTTMEIPSTVMLLVASVLSLYYIALHNTTAHLQRRTRDQVQSQKVDNFRKMATFTLRVLMSLWLVTCLVSVTWTGARHPLCEMGRSQGGLYPLSPLDRGSTCIMNRVAILASVVALFISTILFILLRKVNEPFRCHLFGIVRESDLLPLHLPYNPTKRLTRYPTGSAMSFQCRSSQSLSRETFAPWTSAEVHQLPPIPSDNHNANIRGLGIQTTRSSAPPLSLSPRPPLRSHTSLPIGPPPPSPLPPFPSYLPNNYWLPTPPPKPTHPPPRRPTRPDQTFDFDFVHSPTTDHLRPPPRALSADNLHILDRSLSRSSIYSRSTSGEARAVPALCSASSSGTLTTSSSASTLRQDQRESPLKTMHVAETPQKIVLASLSNWDLVDVAALEAKMAKMAPPVRLRSRSGIATTCHVKDCWVESPNLGLEKAKSLRRAKSCKLVKVRRYGKESGVEHGMF